MKTFIVLIIIMLFSINSYTQQIKGVVKDNSNKPLQNVSVIIKSNIDETSILKYTTTNSSGNYSIDLNLDSFIIEFRLISYYTKTVEIKDFLKTKAPSIINIKLKTDITALKEVTVISKKNEAIQVKKDTVTFSPNRFKDGTERVVEDLIRKLPGMKVEDNGRIYFKGKAVENLLLDGDDLFDSNYIIGSRNIDVNMIEELSAIENYIENPLLHGVKKSKAVAINLILKKGKADFSNNISIGAGIENRLNLNSNTLGVSKKVKSFSTINYNNIGEEQSPFDYFSSNNITFENINNQSFKLPKILEDENFNSEIGNNRSRINNNIFTSINTIYNVSKKIGLKLNFDFKKDELKQNIFSQTNYIDGIDAVSFIQNKNIIKEPKIMALNLKLNYKISNKELIEYKAKIERDRIRTKSFISLNEINQFNNTFFEQDYFKQNLNYTKRLKKNKALVSELLFSLNKTPQTAIFSPDFRIEDVDVESKQSVNLKKIFLNFQTILLNATRTSNTKFAIGYTFEKNEFNSLLNIDSGILKINNSINNFIFQNSYPWVKSDLRFKLGKWIFHPIINIKYLNEKLKENGISGSAKEINRLLIEPKVDLVYLINKTSNLNFLGVYNEKTLDLNNIYKNTIFTSNKNAVNNVIDLKTIKSYNAKLIYNRNDFFNLSQISFGLNLLRQRNNFISNISFENLYIENTKKLTNLNYDTAFLNLNFDKYLSIIKSNVKLNLAYGINSYKNVIEGAGIRDNTSYNGYYSFNIKTGFLKSINFENNIQINTMSFKTNSFKGEENVSIHNKFKFYLKPTNRIRLVSGFDFYLPNSNESSNYFYFIDNSIYLKSKNGKINYILTSKNLTSKGSSFTRNYVSDFSTTSTSYNLLKPYMMLTVDFRF